LIVYLKSRPCIRTLSPISFTILMGTIFLSPNPNFDDIPPSSSSIDSTRLESKSYSTSLTTPT
jgi:hypothetical protein